MLIVCLVADQGARMTNFEPHCSVLPDSRLSGLRFPCVEVLAECQQLATSIINQRLCRHHSHMHVLVSSNHIVPNIWEKGCHSAFVLPQASRAQQSGDGPETSDECEQ